MARSCLNGQSQVRRVLVRRFFIVLLVVLSAIASGCGSGGGHGTTADPAVSHPHHRSRVAPRPPPGPFALPLGRAHLAPGSDPSVLPADVLIADRSNNRLLVVDPKGRIVWRFPRPGEGNLPLPDDAFFSP